MAEEVKKDNYDFRLEMEREVVKFLEEKWSCSFIETERDSKKWGASCPVDGFMVRDKKMVAMIENRNRKESLEFVVKCGGILINYDKLNKAITLSQTLKIPFFFVAYFFNDDKLVYWKVVNEDGLIDTEIKLTRKLAQDNLEGGTEKKRERNVGILSNEGMKHIASDIKILKKIKEQQAQKEQ